MHVIPCSPYTSLLLTFSYSHLHLHTLHSSFVTLTQHPPTPHHLHILCHLCSTLPHMHHVSSPVHHTQPTYPYLPYSTLHLYTHYIHPQLYPTFVTCHLLFTLHNPYLPLLILHLHTYCIHPQLYPTFVTCYLLFSLHNPPTYPYLSYSQLHLYIHTTFILRYLY